MQGWLQGEKSKGIHFFTTHLALRALCKHFIRVGVTVDLKPIKGTLTFLGSGMKLENL